MASKKVELGEILYFNEEYYMVIKGTVYYVLVNLSQGVVTKYYDTSIPGLLYLLKDHEIISMGFFHKEDIK